MIDFKKLAGSMGELDEDTVVALLRQVMEEGGGEAQTPAQGLFFSHTYLHGY